MKQVNEYRVVMAIAIAALICSVVSYHVFGV
jgi:hypothetical protein